MSDRGGGNDTQPPPSEIDDYAADEQTLSPSAAHFVRPRRWFIRSAIVFFVCGVVALLVAIGITNLGPANPPKSPQDEPNPPPKRPDRFSEQPIEAPEPFKSLVLDSAQSYLATQKRDVATKRK